MVGHPAWTCCSRRRRLRGGRAGNGVAGAHHRSGWREQQRKRRMVGELRSTGQRRLRAVGRRGQIFRSADPRVARGSRPVAARMPALQDARAAAPAGAGVVEPADPVPHVRSGFGGGAGPGRADCSRARSSMRPADRRHRGAAAVHCIVRLRRNRGWTQFEELLPEAIDLIGPGPPRRAIRFRRASRWRPTTAREPVAGEFRRVFEEQRFGLPLQDSLLGMADRIGLVDVRILVTAILIQREVGGNLAEILDNLSSVDPRAVHHPPPAQGLHRAGPDDRLPAGAAAVHARSPCSTRSTRSTCRCCSRTRSARSSSRVALVMQLVGFFWIRKIVNIEI